MDPLITKAQLAARLHKDVADLDDATADLALYTSSGIVRGLTQQTISFVEHETVLLGGATQKLTLPQRPVAVDDDHPLTVVEVGDFGGLDLTLVEDRDFTRLGNELTRGQAWSQTSRLMGWPRTRVLGVWSPRVRVTYSHGYTEIPGDIVDACLDAAVPCYQNPTGLRQRSIDDYSETFASEFLGAALVANLKVKLGLLGRRRGAWSVTPG
ncbi:hypothetical protein [Glycomyces artemisiae]|uniref:PhiE125 gp8 family phage protein n=1 Tax=Glycomyces artemisiae TaxID=1076443 RepID=A0A2T0UEU6_9ACTN|nr:hypothetical protein [Glycomyces artemisiae]PRY56443.1 hypothetical protein B0I28_10992 [Glycomyces artemisiae]